MPTIFRTVTLTNCVLSLLRRQQYLNCNTNYPHFMKLKCSLLHSQQSVISRVSANPTFSLSNFATKIFIRLHGLFIKKKFQKTIKAAHTVQYIKLHTLFSTSNCTHCSAHQTEHTPFSTSNCTHRSVHQTAHTVQHIKLNTHRSAHQTAHTVQYIKLHTLFSTSNCTHCSAHKTAHSVPYIKLYTLFSTSNCTHCSAHQTAHTVQHIKLHTVFRT